MPEILDYRLTWLIKKSPQIDVFTSYDGPKSKTVTIDSIQELERLMHEELKLQKRTIGV